MMTARRDDEAGNDGVGRAPHFLFAVDFFLLLENRDERRRQRAFAEQSPEQIRDLKREQKCVRDPAVAHETRINHFAHHAEHAAEQRGGGHRAGRFQHLRHRAKIKVQSLKSKVQSFKAIEIGFCALAIYPARVSILEELKWRGLIADCTDAAELEKKISAPITLYCGFDPTADSVCMSAISFRCLRCDDFNCSDTIQLPSRAARPVQSAIRAEKLKNVNCSRRKFWIATSPA